MRRPRPGSYLKDSYGCGTYRAIAASAIRGAAEEHRFTLYNRHTDHAKQRFLVSKDANLAAGAGEVWVINEEGSVCFLDAKGERASSSFAVKLSPPARAPKI